MIFELRCVQSRCIKMKHRAMQAEVSDYVKLQSVQVQNC